MRRSEGPPAFAFTGGGTGGHVIPALAVARELRQRGRKVFFIGTERGIEARLVPADGFPLEFVRIGGLKAVGWRQRLSSLWLLPIGSLRAMRLLRGAGVLFSMGGYAAGPAVLAALARRIPVVVMEPNAVPGFTNRHIARFVARALVGFPETARFFPPGRTEITGLPVREEFFRIPPRPRGEVLNLLITGGSQGSRTLNEASRRSWPLFREARFPVRILHQAGRTGAAALASEFAASGLPGEVVEFIRDMPAAFAEADLVVSRSGAGAVAELAAAGKPSILSPFPFAADQHQLRNAEAMQRAGAARLVEDRETTGERLFAEVRELASQPDALERMGAAARALAKPGAAARAADIMEGAVRTLFD
jgi:UDP-N-acetylglucosamine--N-acetylmuramyl-(pentapeptide) pyrophosphoryl-undecaprenol N-acetylglucosamine transferase